MAYQKVPRPSTVYHLTKKEHLDSILDDGVIRRFDDTECWFCESLEKMKAYMAQTVLCEGKPYYAVGGQLCRYPKFVPEDYVLLRLTPRGYEDNWYRWNQEVPPGSPRGLVQAAKEFSLLKIGYRGDMAFRSAEVIDVALFLTDGITQGEPVQTTSELRELLFEHVEREQREYTDSLYRMTQGISMTFCVTDSAWITVTWRRWASSSATTTRRLNNNHEKRKCHDLIRERAACSSRIFT